MTEALQVGYLGPLSTIQKQWIGYNDGIDKEAQIYESKSPDKKTGKYIFKSVCYCAPLKGWKDNSICKAHIFAYGVSHEAMEVKSVGLDHTCSASHGKRQRNYRSRLLQDGQEGEVVEKKKTRTEKVVRITVGIAGGTGSGKSTLARELVKRLGGAENVLLISHDNYYKDLSDKTLEEREKNNFDHPDSLDTALFVRQMRDLRRGRPIIIPQYDFPTHTRVKQENSAATSPRKVIIAEGILLFTDPEFRQEMDLKIFVDADADIRLSRRVKRDIAERGRTLESVLDQYATTVKRMHEEWVEPTKTHADIIVETMGNKKDVAIEVITAYIRQKAKIR